MNVFRRLQWFRKKDKKSHKVLVISMNGVRHSRSHHADDPLNTTDDRASHNSSANNLFVPEAALPPNYRRRYSAINTASTINSKLYNTSYGTQFSSNNNINNNNNNNNNIGKSDQLASDDAAALSNDEIVAKTKESFFQRTTIHGVSDLGTATHCTEKILWVVLLLAAVGMACFQSYETFINYIAKETGTRFIIADRSAPESMAELVKLVYCPQNWFSIDKVNRDPGKIDKSLLLYALSLIPYADGWAMMSLWRNMTSSDRRGRVKYHGAPPVKTINSSEERLGMDAGEILFDDFYASDFDFSESDPSMLWSELETVMKRRKQASLAALLSNFTGSLLQRSLFDSTVEWDAYDPEEPFVFRSGRLCQNVQAQAKPVVYKGDAHDFFVFPFRFNQMPSMPKPRYLMSPYLGVEVGDSFQEIMYTDMFDSNFDWYYKEDFMTPGVFIINLRLKVQMWHHLHFESKPCKDVEARKRNRYLAGHYALHCQHLCYDLAHRTVFSNNCSLLRNYRPLRPCSFSRFAGRPDTNITDLVPGSALKVAFDECVNKRRCHAFKDCEDWLFEMDEYVVPRPNQYRTMPNHKSTEHLTASVHQIEITFRSGVQYEDYLLVNDQAFIGGVGGIFGLFIGASILSVIQLVVYLGKFFWVKLSTKFQPAKPTTVSRSATGTEYNWGQDCAATADRNAEFFSSSHAPQHSTGIYNNPKSESYSGFRFNHPPDH